MIVSITSPQHNIWCREDWQLW